MTYPIKGIPRDPEDPIPFRKDVDDWYHDQVDPSSNRIQLSLFVEALAAIQQRPLSDERSYFRLAGIHSAPYTGWDGVGGVDQVGFCVHGNYTFPTWHRVYMTLFEQAVYEAMLEFIDQPEHSSVAQDLKNKWKAEAKQWRLPYWDFARFARHYTSKPHEQVIDDNPDTRELRLPILASMPLVKISVFGSNNEFQFRPNPLYKFEMEKPMGELDPPYTITAQIDGDTEYPFDKCKATTRYGLMDGYHADVLADGGQHWPRVNLALNEHAWGGSIGTSPERNATLQELTHRLLLSQIDSWGDFSSTRNDKKHARTSQRNYLNLEAIHNNIHNWVGGFYYKRPGPDSWKLWGAGHMSNVPVAAFDPIFWLYHCNIDRLAAIWQALNWDKYFDDPASSGCLNVDLAPFHKDDKGISYTSNDVRDWRSLNFDYEITESRDPDKITAKVNELYGESTVALPDAKDYILTVKYDRYALGGRPFLINIFIGEVDRKNFYDAGARNFVGSVFNFSAPIENTQCRNCIEQQEQGVMSVAQLPATWAIKYRDIDVEDVKLSYVVVDSRGKSARVKVETKLCESIQYLGFPGGGTDYHNIADGAPAEVDY
ncbi:tyrosinase domain protein [Nemania sp. FL0916]|nr:tyrosinase domain protein [Nemania sp. FL0916]